MLTIKTGKFSDNINTKTNLNKTDWNKTIKLNKTWANINLTKKDLFVLINYKKYSIMLKRLILAKIIHKATNQFLILINRAYKNSYQILPLQKDKSSL